MSRRHDAISYEDYLAEESAYANETAEPAPWKGPLGPDGKVLPQYRVVEGGDGYWSNQP